MQPNSKNFSQALRKLEVVSQELSLEALDILDHLLPSLCRPTSSAWPSRSNGCSYLIFHLHANSKFTERKSDCLGSGSRLAFPDQVSIPGLLAG